MPHHAYYIEGPLSVFAAYKEALSPYYAREYERFGIDEARELVAVAGLKNYQQSVFLLGIAAITSEAQQALLKLLEEPQENTVFVLMVPHGTLIPTIKSRMLPYPDLQQGSTLLNSARSNLAGQFLKSSGKDRSDFITKLLKDDENQKERVRDFIQALEAELYKKIPEPAVRQALEDIAMVRDYVRDRSPSLKMLLEHLALVLPTG